MDFLQTLLFENPIWLGLFCFGIFAAVLLIRPRVESASFRRWSLPLTLGVIVAMFALQAGVTTQREEVLESLYGFVAAIEAGSLSRASPYISRQYDDGHMDRDGCLDSLESMFGNLKIRDTRYGNRDITFDDNMAELDLNARATVSIRGEVGQLHFGRWKIGWSEEATGWKITRIKPIMIDGRNVSSIRAIRRITEP